MRKTFHKHKNDLAVKFKESAVSVLPIILIVMALSLSVIPLKADLVLSFLIGALMLIAGMCVFTLGAETAMTPIGSRVGAALTKSRSRPFIMIVSFALGIAITMAEPDLQVLAETVPHIENFALLITVGVGVGVFLVVGVLRILMGVPLRWLLLASYAVVFILAIFTETNALGIAFDSGGVTTGPMTVPFILALGIGMSTPRSDERAESDSFGLVALSSIGPILAVFVLGFFFSSENAEIQISAAAFENTAQIGQSFLAAIPHHLIDTMISLLPIAVVFVLFQMFVLKIPGRSFLKISLGILYTCIGLTLFLTGVNVGFSTLGAALGAQLTNEATRFILIPLSMLLGWFIISAEPAVYVLEKQIEEVSAGAIPGKAIKTSLSVAISLAMGMAMLRVITGLSILWFLVPGYIIALLLSFFVPDIYTSIAFDSGGVASGPMTATFMLQFMIGASGALGGNAIRDAFGVVALVAMMPLISIQTMGLIYNRRAAPARETEAPRDEYEIIELWEAKP